MAVAFTPARRASGAEVQPFRWTRERYDEAVEAGIFTPEDKVELLDGEIVPKMPQNNAHRTSTLLVGQALREAFAGVAFIQEEKPVALTDLSEPEPDVAVVRGRVRDYADGHPQTEHLLLLVEVSDSSLIGDRIRKASLYAAAGIAEYWIVNLQDNVLEVQRDPAGDAYRTKTTFASGESVTPVHAPEASIFIADLLP